MRSRLSFLVSPLPCCRSQGRSFTNAKHLKGQASNDSNKYKSFLPESIVLIKKATSRKEIEDILAHHMALFRECLASRSPVEQSHRASPPHDRRGRVGHASGHASALLPPPWTEAFFFATWARDPVRPFNAALHRLSQVDPTARAAVALFRQMQGPSWHRVPPSAVSYATLMYALTKAGRPAEALALWDELQSSGVRPTVRCHHAALVAMADELQWRLAVDTVSAMLRKHGRRARESGVRALDGVRGGGGGGMGAKAPAPDEACFAAGISACGRAGQTRAALNLFDEMKRWVYRSC